MAERSIATKVSIEGEKQYTAALKNINSSLGALNAQMKATTAEFQTNANSEEALRAKSETLNAAFQKQQEKINLLNQAIGKGQAAQNQWKSAMDTTKSSLDGVNQKLSALDDKTKQNGQQWNTYNSQLKAAQAELKALKSSTGDTSAEQDKLKTKISDLKDKMKSLNESTNGAAKQTGELLQEQAKLTGQLEKQEKGYDSTTNKVNSWQRQLYNAQAASYGLSSEIEKNNQYLEEAKNSSDRCATSIDKFGKETKEASEDIGNGANGINELSDSMNALSSMLIASKITQAVKEIANAFGDCIDAASKFGYTMATVKAVSGASAEEISALESQAKSYAANSIFFISDIADSYKTMGQAGWEAQQMLDGMSGVMNLAAASGEDLSATTSTVVDALNAFGYTAADAGHFADVLARTAADSNTTVAQLSESFKSVSSIAGAFGFSIDDVAVALGAMANNGLKAEMSGTALSTSLTRMTGANQTAAKAMDRLGLSMLDESGNMKELGVYLGELREKFAGMTEQQKIQNAYQLAGARGMKGLLAIVNTSAGDWDDLTHSIAECNDAANEMANVQLDTYAGQVLLLKSATEGLRVEVGQQLEPAMGNLVDTATNVVKGITEFIQTNEEAIPIVTGVTTSVGTFAAGVTAATVLVRVFTIATTALGTSFGPIALAVGLASVAIGALSTILVAAGNDTENVTEKLRDAKKSFEETSDTHAANRESLLQEAAETNQLADRLTVLIGRYDGTASSAAEINEIINKLNSSVPELNLSWDEQTNALNMTSEAMYALIKRQQMYDELMEAFSNRDDMKNRYEESAEAVKSALEKLQEARSALTEAESLAAEGFVGGNLEGLRSDVEGYQAIYDQAVQHMADASSAYSKSQNQVNELSDAYDNASSSAERFSDSSEEAADATSKVSEEVAELYAGMKEATGSAEELYDAYDEYKKSLEELKPELDDATYGMMEQELAGLRQKAVIADLNENYGFLVNRMSEMGWSLTQSADWFTAHGTTVDEWGKQVEEDIDTIINDFEVLDTSTELTLSKISENLQKNIDAYTSWNSNIGILMNQAKEIFQETGDTSAIVFVQKMAEMGIGAAGEVQLMADNMDYTFSEIAPKFAEAADASIQGVTERFQNDTDVQNAITEFNAKIEGGLGEADTTGAGQQSAEGFSSGMEAASGDVEATAEGIASSVTDTMGEHSGEFENAGAEAGEKINAGLSSQKTNIESTSRTIAQSVAAAMRSVSWYAVGYNISSGIASGVRGGSSLITTAATNAANSAYNAATSTLQIKSPSRKMAEVGRFFDEGFAKGIIDNIGTVSKAVTEATTVSIPDVSKLKTSPVSQTVNNYGTGNGQLEALVEKYLPEILDKMGSGGYDPRTLARQLTPYIDSNMGMTESRKRRGN